MLAGKQAWSPCLERHKFANPWASRRHDGLWDRVAGVSGGGEMDGGLAEVDGNSSDEASDGETPAMYLDRGRIGISEVADDEADILDD